MSRLDKIIQSGDAVETLRVGLAARSAAERGEFCECAEPDLTGYDLMCGHCLLENEGQRQRRERAMKEPHEFVPMRGLKSENYQMCQFCSGWNDDARHQLASPGEGQAGKRTNGQEAQEASVSETAIRERSQAGGGDQ